MLSIRGPPTGRLAAPSDVDKRDVTLLLLLILVVLLLFVYFIIIIIIQLLAGPQRRRLRLRVRHLVSRRLPRDVAPSAPLSASMFTPSLRFGGFGGV